MPKSKNLILSAGLHYLLQNVCIPTPVKVRMADIFDMLSKQIAANSAAPLDTTCILWTGPLTSDKLYGLLSYKDPKTNLWRKKHVHRVALMVKLRRLEIPKELDASHLCHNRMCVNAEHLALEPHAVNNNRQHCRSLGKCFGHGTYLECMLHLKPE